MQSVLKCMMYSTDNETISPADGNDAYLTTSSTTFFSHLRKLQLNDASMNGPEYMWKPSFSVSRLYIRENLSGSHQLHVPPACLVIVAQGLQRGREYDVPPCGATQMWRSFSSGSSYTTFWCLDLFYVTRPVIVSYRASRWLKII